MKYVPNILTVLRIICASLLLVTPVYSSAFYVLFLICGITDFLDGRIARKYQLASKAGASLDNIADYLLIISSIIKVVPTLVLERWVLIWGVIMLVTHVSSSVIAWFKYKKIVILHTVANKILGGAVFVIPLLAGFGNHTLLIALVCALMCFSVPEEIYLLLTSKQFEPDVRGVFFDNSNVHRGYADVSDTSATPNND